MTIHTALIASGLIAVSLISGATHAALQGRYLTSGATSYEAYYDTDLNITWLAETANYLRWAEANNWAANLSFTIGGSVYDNWRLPKVVDTGTPGCNWAFTGTDCGFNVDTATSEMAHLFYDEMGNKALYDTSGNVQEGPYLTNTPGPFTNFHAYFYWSGSKSALDTSEAWYFSFDTGYQATHSQVFAAYHALAVSPGDVVPRPPGSSASDPIMPTVATQAGWEFNFNVAPNQQYFIDPVVAVGYDYLVDTGSPFFTSVLLPSVGDDLYDLHLWNGTDWILNMGLTAGDEHFFDGSGVDRFRILGIETGAGLDPGDPTAFVTGLTFASEGDVSMSMNPITLNIDPNAVPEPASLALLGIGLAGFAAMRRRKSV